MSRYLLSGAMRAVQVHGLAIEEIPLFCVRLLLVVELRIMKLASSFESNAG